MHYPKGAQAVRGNANGELAMTNRTLMAAIGISIAAGLAAPLSAQETPPAPPTSEDTEKDNIADDLNARRRVNPTATVKRVINGEIVETKKVPVPDEAYPNQPTEAGMTASEVVRLRIDRETLTRTEAAEEARLDFDVADQNNDSNMSLPELEALFAVRPIDPNYAMFFKNGDVRKDEQDPQLTGETATRLADRFFLMQGTDEKLGETVYVRHVINEFDVVDHDGDGVLKGEELNRFRARQLARERRFVPNPAPRGL